MKNIQLMNFKKFYRIKYLIKRIILSLKNDKLRLIFSKFNYFFSGAKIDLDNFKLDPKLSLDDICLTFGTDKGFLDGKKNIYTY